MRREKPSDHGAPVPLMSFRDMGKESKKGYLQSLEERASYTEYISLPLLKHLAWVQHACMVTMEIKGKGRHRYRNYLYFFGRLRMTDQEFEASLGCMRVCLTKKCIRISALFEITLPMAYDF